MAASFESVPQTAQQHRPVRLLVQVLAVYQLALNLGQQLLALHRLLQRRLELDRIGLAIGQQLVHAGVQALVQVFRFVDFLDDLAVAQLLGKVGFQIQLGLALDQELADTRRQALVQVFRLVDLVDDVLIRQGLGELGFLVQLGLALVQQGGDALVQVLGLVDDLGAGELLDDLVARQAQLGDRPWLP